MATRSLFSLSSSQCHDIINEASQIGVNSLFILTTCNRTEIYAFCSDERIVADLLVKYSNGSKVIFEQNGFIKTGSNALRHLYYVAAGLDSQITGDFEILGQLKNAVAFSRQRNMIDTLMDRTVNFALQSSKSIRTNTKLSSGTVSVSYAAIEWLKKKVDISNKTVLLIGTGKFGKTLAKNLRHYFPDTRVTILNRTEEPAKTLAETLSFNWKPYSSLEEEAIVADIIIVCTNAAGYILGKHSFSATKEQWVMDLSVPENVDPSVSDLPGINLIGIDEISLVLNATLAKRNDEIPKAVSIIEQYQGEFFNWLHMQRHVPAINDMKIKLFRLGEVHFSHVKNQNHFLNSHVNRTIGSLAMDLRYKEEKGCHYIRAINEFLEPVQAQEQNNLAS